MHLTDDRKVDILVSAMNERCSSVHNIRRRAQDVCFWVLGIFAAASGWLIESGRILSTLDKVVYIAFAFLAYILIRAYLQDLRRGFKGQLTALSRIETALNFYTPGYFTQDHEALYPAAWQRAGTSDGDGKYFKSSYHLLQFGIIVFILAVLFSSWL